MKRRLWANRPTLALRNQMRTPADPLCDGYCARLRLAEFIRARLAPLLARGRSVLRPWPLTIKQIFKEGEDKMKDVTPHWRLRQIEDRNERLAQIRRAGDKSRRRERERKKRLAAETAAVLTNGKPQLRKRSGPASGSDHTLAPYRR